LLVFQKFKIEYFHSTHYPGIFQDMICLGTSPNQVKRLLQLKLMVAEWHARISHQQKPLTLDRYRHHPALRLSALAPGKQRQSDLEVTFPVFSPAPATCRSDGMLPFGRRNCKSSALRVELESPTGVGPMHRRLLRAVSRKEETRPSRSSPSPTARSTGTDGEQGTARSPTESRGLHAC
jgi:hypothetical protein